MQRVLRPHIALAAGITAALIVGCNGSPLASAPVAVPQAATTASLRANRGALLYIADPVTHEVQMYDWPGLAHAGTLTGLNTPMAVCVDPGGGVWIVNANGSDIVKYSHGGTYPVKKLSDRGYFPNDCSVNPKNGDVAVANERPQVGTGSGSITIFKGAIDSPITYADAAFHRIMFLAYDANGNLFLDGKDNAGRFLLAKFKDKQFTPIAIDGAKIVVPGGVLVDGPALLVGDQVGPYGRAVVYQITETGTVTSTTNTQSTACAQYFVTGSAKHQKLICPNYRGPSVDVYDYPSGGAPLEQIKAGLEFPFGAAVSP